MRKLILFLLIAGSLYAQVKNRNDLAIYNSAKEKTHATVAAFDTSSVVFDIVSQNFRIFVVDSVGARQFEITSAGKVILKSFQMATGASANYVLTSDANGVGTWAAASGGSGGSGDLCFRCEPQHAKLAGADITTAATISSALRDWALLFDASTAEQAMWTFVAYPLVGDTVTVKIFYTMASATTNEVEWVVDFMSVTDADAQDWDGASFASSKNAVVTIPGTAGYMDVATIDFTLAEADNMAQYDIVRIRITTDASDGTNDDAARDREFRGAIVYAH